MLTIKLCFESVCLYKFNCVAERLFRIVSEMSKADESTYVIYSCSSGQATPIGFVVGDIYRTEHMIAINPLLNSLELRMVKATDKDHKHMTELANKEGHVTVSFATRFDVGSLMGFSGWQCFHMTMKTLVILYVKTKVISTSIERVVDNGGDLIIRGDVRIMADESVAQIFVLRGEAFSGGKLVGLNRERNFNLNLIEAFKLPQPVWSNQPMAATARSSTVTCPAPNGNIIADGGRQAAPMTNENRTSLMAMTKNLYYVGIVKKTDEAKEVLVVNALISGFVQRAQPEPYRFSKGVSEFTIKFVGTSPPADVVKAVEDNPNLINVSLAPKSAISLHSLSGNGLDVFGETASIKICGHILLVDERDGSLINRLTGRHTVKLAGGHLKLYVFDDDIMVLDNPTVKYQVE